MTIPKHNLEYTAALVDLTNALNDFKKDRGDALNVVGAIQRFVHAKLMQYDSIRVRESSSADTRAKP